MATKMLAAEARRRLKAAGYTKYIHVPWGTLGPAVFAFSKSRQQWIGVAEDEWVDDWNERLWEANFRLVAAVEALKGARG